MNIENKISPNMDSGLIRDIVEVDIGNNSIQECNDDDKSEKNDLIKEDEKSVVICGRSLNVNSSQLITIILLSVYFILSSSYYSLFAPFYPAKP